MRPILPLELVGNEKLDFDLYDDKGQAVYKNGEALTPDVLIKLCSIKIFVKDESAEKSSDTANNQKILKHKSVIPDQVAKTLVNISKNILKRIHANEKPDIASCNEATDIIVEEVSINLEKIDCISQLKIFDEYTFSHTLNVSTMSTALGMSLGLDENELKELAMGALLHDIGKMLVPKDILNKPAKLDKIAKVALDHQENYGGGGYPNGLKGTEINFYAQITAIADTYDALTSNRIYKRAIDSDSAIDIMLSEGSDRFNPYILNQFINITDYNNRPDDVLEENIDDNLNC